MFLEHLPSCLSLGLHCDALDRTIGFHLVVYEFISKSRNTVNKQWLDFHLYEMLFNQLMINVSIMEKPLD